MDLLVAYRDDPAGNNMAEFLSRGMRKDGDVFRGDYFDLLVIATPAISADWLGDTYDHDSFVFLSKHAAESGVLALTCHSTGNFSEARFGGRDRQVAIPYPSLQKQYLQRLFESKGRFPGFDITIEATHHGPSALDRPCLFIEVGTTPEQWSDRELCTSVAEIVLEAVKSPRPQTPYAICLGGTHYSEKFTRELLHGRLGLGTVIPRHALEFLDQELFDHVIQRNTGATAVILDWAGLGQHKQKVMDLVSKTDLEVIRL